MNIGAKIFLSGLVILAIVRALVAMADRNDNAVAIFLGIGTLGGLFVSSLGAIIWIWSV